MSDYAYVVKEVDNFRPIAFFTTYTEAEKYAEVLSLDYPGYEYEITEHLLLDSIWYWDKYTVTFNALNDPIDYKYQLTRKYLDDAKLLTPLTEQVMEYRKSDAKESIDGVVKIITSTFEPFIKTYSLLGELHEFTLACVAPSPNAAIDACKEKLKQEKQYVTENYKKIRRK